jgi:hypothetical protein
MPNKSFSDSATPEWEQPYLQKPEIPDWKEYILAADIEEQGPNEFDILFTETNENLLQRDNVTERASFLKKDNVKIAQEIRSRLDRFLKNYKHEVIDSEKQQDLITCSVKLTSKDNNSKTIVACFSFGIHRPELFNVRASAEKVEALPTFECSGEQYPINKHGFDTAFATHGVKYADSHILTTLYQLEEQYEADDVIKGIESGHIVSLNEKVYVCESSYLNALKPLIKQASIDSSFLADRHAEIDSDSGSRLQNIEKQQTQFEVVAEVNYGYHTETSILAEIKTQFGLVGAEAQNLLQSSLDKGLLSSIPGGFITEGKFSDAVKQAGLATENKLSPIMSEFAVLAEIKAQFGLVGAEAQDLLRASLEKGLLSPIAGGFITKGPFSEAVRKAGLATENKLSAIMDQLTSNPLSKIPGEFRNEAQGEISQASLLTTAKSKIDSKNVITSHEVVSEGSKTLIKVSTMRKVAAYEIPADYYFCFKGDGTLKGAHAQIVGKNCQLNKLASFYQELEKECLRREATEHLHADHHQELAPLHRNDSYNHDDVRAPKAIVDTDRFASVKNNLVNAVKTAQTKNLLTASDVEIFIRKIGSSKQISELTQIEKEFKILTDTWSL